jgi:hypothetical protein
MGGADIGKKAANGGSTRAGRSKVGMRDMVAAEIGTEIEIAARGGTERVTGRDAEVGVGVVITRKTGEGATTDGETNAIGIGIDDAEA